MEIPEQKFQTRVTYVKANTQEDLIRKVERLMTEGWKPDGDSRFQFGLHRQSMIKEIKTINDFIADKIQTVEVRMS